MLKEHKPRKPLFGKLTLPGVEPIPQEMFEQLIKFSRLNMKVFYNLVASREMFRAQMMYIKAIGDNEGMSQSELAEHIGVERASVTTAVQRMEKAGLVERRCDEEDQRVTRLYLTEKARKKNVQTDKELARYVNQCMNIDPETAETVIDAIKRINLDIELYLEKTRGSSL